MTIKTQQFRGGGIWKYFWFIFKNSCQNFKIFGQETADFCKILATLKKEKKVNQKKKKKKKNQQLLKWGRSCLWKRLYNVTPAQNFKTWSEARAGYNQTVEAKSLLLWLSATVRGLKVFESDTVIESVWKSEECTQFIKLLLRVL